MDVSVWQIVQNGVVAGLTFAQTVAWQRAMTSLLSFAVGNPDKKEGPAELVLTAVLSSILCFGGIVVLAKVRPTPDSRA